MTMASTKGNTKINTKIKTDRPIVLRRFFIGLKISPIQFTSVNESPLFTTLLINDFVR